MRKTEEVQKSFDLKVDEFTESMADNLSDLEISLVSKAIMSFQWPVENGIPSSVVHHVGLALNMMGDFYIEFAKAMNEESENA